MGRLAALSGLASRYYVRTFAIALCDCVDDPTLVCRPRLEVPSSWGGFLNDCSNLEGALGERLAKDVTELAVLLTSDECEVDEWIRGCSQRREPNLRMLPCVRFDVPANGEVSNPQFFMVRSLRCLGTVVCGGVMVQEDCVANSAHVMRAHAVCCTMHDVVVIGRYMHQQTSRPVRERPGNGVVTSQYRTSQ